MGRIVYVLVPVRVELSEQTYLDDYAEERIVVDSVATTLTVPYVQDVLDKYGTDGVMHNSLQDAEDTLLGF